MVKHHSKETQNSVFEIMELCCYAHLDIIENAAN